MAAGGPLANGIDTIRRHVRPSLKVISGGGGAPSPVECGVSRREFERRVLLGQASYLAQKFPIASYPRSQPFVPSVAHPARRHRACERFYSQRAVPLIICAVPEHL